MVFVGPLYKALFGALLFSSEALKTVRACLVGGVRVSRGDTGPLYAVIMIKDQVLNGCPSDAVVNCEGAASCEGAGSITADTVICDGEDSCRGVERITARVLQCNGQNSCRDVRTIHATTVTCSGLVSCLDVGSISATGTVNCVGQRACGRVGTIEASSKVVCDSPALNFGACEDVGAITAAQVECNRRSDCVRVGTITATQKVTCGGEFSCSNVGTISADVINCPNRLSCRFVNTITATSQVLCTGEQSCQGVLSMTGNGNALLTCGGSDSALFQSCIHAAIGIMVSGFSSITCDGFDNCRCVRVTGTDCLECQNEACRSVGPICQASFDGVELSDASGTFGSCTPPVQCELVTVIGAYTITVNADVTGLQSSELIQAFLDSYQVYEESSTPALDCPPTITGVDITEVVASGDEGRRRLETSSTISVEITSEQTSVGTIFSLPNGDPNMFDSTFASIVGATEASTEFKGATAVNDKSGGAFDDPHFLTWLGKSFDFQGACDLVLISLPSFDGFKGLHIHLRTTIRYFYSYIESASVQIGDDTLEVSSWCNYMLNSVQAAEAQGMSLADGAFPVNFKRVSDKKCVFEILLRRSDPNNSSVEREDEAIYIQVFKDFVSVRVKHAKESDFQDSRGMMGGFQSGKMLARDGETVLDDPIEYGQEWQVRDTEPQLFQAVRPPQYPQACVLPDGSDNKMPKESSRIRRRLKQSSVSLEQAKDACAKYYWSQEKELQACIYDVQATGDLEMAEAGAF